MSLGAGEAGSGNAVFGRNERVIASGEMVEVGGNDPLW